MRKILFLALVPLAACGGGGSDSAGTSPEVATSATTIATTVATTVAATTSTTTTTTTTTLPPTTTIPVLKTDATLAKLLNAPPEMDLVAGDAQDLGAFDWLRTPWPSVDDPTFAAYSHLSATKDGAPYGDVLLLRTTPGLVANAEEEVDLVETFGDATAKRLGGSSEVDFLTIEEAAFGNATDSDWRAWYHEGVMFVVWADSAKRADSLAAWFALEQHGHPMWATVDEMEGELNLTAHFSELNAGCSYEPATKYIKPAELIQIGDGWRSTFPYAQHFGLQIIRCTGKGPVATLSLVQFHPELADHQDLNDFLLPDNGVVVKMTIGGIDVGIDGYGIWRWVDDGVLHQLRWIDDNPPKSSYDLLFSIAEALILGPQ